MQTAPPKGGLAVFVYLNGKPRPRDGDTATGRFSGFLKATLPALWGFRGSHGTPLDTAGP